MKPIKQQNPPTIIKHSGGIFLYLNSKKEKFNMSHYIYDFQSIINLLIFFGLLLKNSFNFFINNHFFMLLLD